MRSIFTERTCYFFANSTSICPFNTIAKLHIPVAFSFTVVVQTSTRLVSRKNDEIIIKKCLREISRRILTITKTILEPWSCLQRNTGETPEGISQCTLGKNYLEVSSVKFLVETLKFLKFLELFL